MAVKLRHIDTINQAITREHESWVIANAKDLIDYTNINTERYSILDYPQLWSGARLFETKVEQAGKDSPANDEIAELIKKAKGDNKNDPAKLKKIESFEKGYKKFLASLKERCLLQAISQTIDGIDAPENPDAKSQFAIIKQGFKDILNSSSLLNMQTRVDCLEAHKQITLLLYAMKNKVDPSQHEKVAQLSLLSKRLLDIHYEGAKKITLNESITKNLAATTSFAGLATGIPAAILAIIGIFLPVVLPVAGILGLASFISYTATAVSAVKMANEAINYGRGPSPGDVKWMVIDIVLSPLYIVGGQIFNALSNIAKHGRGVVIGTGYLWNNILANVFPDIFHVKEVTRDTFSMGSIHTATGKLKNTTSATSWQKMRSALAEHDNDALEKISQAKKEISTLNKAKARPKASEEQISDYQELNELAEQIASMTKMNEIGSALIAYFMLEEEQPTHKAFVAKDQYELEVTAKDLALAQIERACEKFEATNQDDKSQLQLSQQIRNLAIKMDSHLIDNFFAFNNAISEHSTSALNGWDFAYTKINQGGKVNSSLAVTKSFHAHILLWESGFMGTFTSKEAQNIKDAVSNYKGLKPDANADTRVEALLRIQEYCETYLSAYKDDKTKGRYSFVDNLSRNVAKELTNLLGFVSSAEQADQAAPVLVGFKAS